MPVEAWAAFAAKEPLASFRYDLPALGALEVDIDITHCGICHSDLHLIDNDWGISTYPFVPGHEIIGSVAAIGAGVTYLKVGQRVGVGWLSGACLQCEYCLRGEENLCAQTQPTCVGRHGGFASRVRVDSRFAFPIPDQLESSFAAPLLCAGVTVFTPLRAFEVTPPMRVGVIGIGGLGHLALQFARAFGCEVTAFSSNSSKEEEARKLGAHHFVRANDSAACAGLGESFDFLLATGLGELDCSMYMPMLKPKGKLCVVGAFSKPLAVQAFSLLSQKSLCGSNTGGRRTMLEMLDFAARHGIRPQVELLPMSEANAAITRVRRNQARYRVVLTN